MGGKWAAVVLLVLALCLPTMRLTPWGRQCPTARVQTVTVAGVSRAPRPGEAGFKQCRCAEKQAAKKAPAPTDAPVTPPLLLVRSGGWQVSPANGRFLVASTPCVRPVGRWLTPLRVPPVPPPNPILV